MARPVFQSNLDRRRRQLGMSQSQLASRAGVSISTVRRVLANHRDARFESVARVARALGFCVDLMPEHDVREMRQNEARRKAERLVRMVQGSSGLEGQAVDDDAIDEMIARTVHELLASRKRLWAA